MNTVSSCIKLFVLNITMLFTISTNLMSMKRSPQNPLSNNTLIAEEIKKYQHYFSPEKKQKLVGHLLTGDKLLDAGFLQAYVASFNSTITPVEQATYLLHKTFKYALDTCEIINSLKKLSKHSYVISRTLHKIYQQLQWFERNENITKYTPHIMCNISFSIAFLNDMAHRRFFFFGDTQGNINEETFKQYCNDMPDGCDDTLMHNFSKNMNTRYNPLIHLFTNKNINNEELSTIQIHFNKCGQTVLLPILNRTGLIGLNTFNYFLSLEYGLVGFGLYLSSVHANTFLSLSDSSYHDFLHILLWIKLNKNLSNLLLHQAFLNKTHILCSELIVQHQKADKNDKEKISQHFTFIFFILHEKAYRYTIHLPHQNKFPLSNTMEKFFKLEKSKDLIDTENINKETHHDYIFNSIDLYFILKHFMPTIDLLMKEKNLTIDQFLLIKADNTNLTGKDLKNFISLISYYMTQVGKNFLHDYKDRFENTFPYE